MYHTGLQNSTFYVQFEDERVYVIFYVFDWFYFTFYFTATFRFYKETFDSRNNKSFNHYKIWFLRQEFNFQFIYLFECVGCLFYCHILFLRNRKNWLKIKTNACMIKYVYFYLLMIFIWYGLLTINMKQLSLTT